jgi:hypothetical protein
MREAEPTGSHKKVRTTQHWYVPSLWVPIWAPLEAFARGNIGNCLLLPLLLLSVSIVMNQEVEKCTQNFTHQLKIRLHYCGTGPSRAVMTYPTMAHFTYLTDRPK